MKRIITMIVLAAMLITSGAAVTPALIFDKADFQPIDRTAAAGYEEPPIASGNKTSTKKVTLYFDGHEWGYLHIGWKQKSKAKGYQIEVSTDKRFQKCVRADVGILYNHATYEGRMSTFRSGKTYYVRVRAAYKSGYGVWSKTKAIVKK